MESWERIFWSASPAFPFSVFHPGRTYVLTDLRLASQQRERIVQEIALDDIAAVRLEQTWYQRVTATSTVRIHSKRAGRCIVLANVYHGPQLALILQLLATDRFGALMDPEFVAGALAPGAPHLLRPNHGLLAAATLALVLMCVMAAVARHDTLAPVTYGADGSIATRVVCPAASNTSSTLRVNHSAIPANTHAATATTAWILQVKTGN